MRFFRCDSGHQAYENARIALDQAWGHPTESTKTLTCIEPAATAPHDAQGRIVLAVTDSFCEYPDAAAMLQFMIGTGEATEITEAEYVAVVQQEPA